MTLTNFVEAKLNEYAQKIVIGGEQSDQVAFGQLSFYLPLRRVLNGKATPEDVGFLMPLMTRYKRWELSIKAKLSTSRLELAE